jgi:hypothetical protein
MNWEFAPEFTMTIPSSLLTLTEKNKGETVPRSPERKAAHSEREERTNKVDEEARQ